MPEERWLPITDYEGFYEVSDHGRVRSLTRLVGNRWGTVTPRKSQILKPAISVGARWYPRVYLCREGTVKEHRIHTLVARAFLGPCPEGLQVLHWDDDKYNNHLSNLRYGTFSDNLNDRYRIRREKAAV